MGNSFSGIENDFIVSPGQCQNLSNDQISYITKQYITILKASSILQTVIDNINNGNNSIDITKPELLVIDTSKVLADLIQGTPLEQTITIFEPIQKPTGKIIDGVSVMKYFTVLDQYNEFFLYQYAVFTSNNDIITKANVIKTNLDLSCKNALAILMNSCNDIGKTQAEILNEN